MWAKVWVWGEEFKVTTIALMHIDIRLAYFNTKPRFENADCKSERHPGRIPKEK